MINYRKSKSTLVKDRHFSAIMTTHVRICQNIMKRYHWVNDCYYYFDLNAGPGIDDDGRVGSPVSFERIAIENKLNYLSYLFEEEKETVDILFKNIEKGKIIEGDHYDNFPKYFNFSQKKNTYGMVFSDESGKIPPFDLIGECFNNDCFYRIDVLIYVASANVKRALNMKYTKEKKRLSELIKTINKQTWIVRQPLDKHQWTFLMGSNWTDYPAFEKIGFYNIVSDKGQEIIYKLDHTNEEIRNGT